MSMYTTGELTKACGVTVRTVQYYDKQNLLNPSELTEGGKRFLHKNSDSFPYGNRCFSLHSCSVNRDFFCQFRDHGSFIQRVLNCLQKNKRGIFAV